MDVAPVGAVFATAVSAHQHVQALAGQIAQQVRLAQDDLTVGVFVSRLGGALGCLATAMRHPRQRRRPQRPTAPRRLENDKVRGEPATSTLSK